mmetsp:Transcript_27913/g.58452  ORF Transcript_27913/g.58452 Transcript_27913/m.58452 type:complete len:213 (+) Transcript_27913:1156-1794(+)
MLFLFLIAMFFLVCIIVLGFGWILFLVGRVVLIVVVGPTMRMFGMFLFDWHFATRTTLFLFASFASGGQPFAHFFHGFLSRGNQIHRSIHNFSPLLTPHGIDHAKFQNGTGQFIVILRIVILVSGFGKTSRAIPNDEGITKDDRGNGLDPCHLGKDNGPRHPTKQHSHKGFKGHENIDTSTMMTVRMIVGRGGTGQSGCYHTISDCTESRPR